MKRQMKIAAVVSATALLAMGASITSMAAVKGTWKSEDGEWHCYNSSGDLIENEWCLSNGKEYYVDSNGDLVRSSWVEYDGDYYFTNSAGEMIKNNWRFTAPYDNEEDEEEWYYFGSNGKRQENKKLTIDGKTYFFDSEGIMLTGWVQGTDGSYDEADSEVLGGTTYYCDEDGARVSKEWVYSYGPGVDEDDLDDDDEEHWYWIQSSGKPKTGKGTSINGKTYFFNVNGEMLYGWVGHTSSNYEMIWNTDDDSTADFDHNLNEYDEVYFCGAEDEGYMKSNKWINAYDNVEYGADDSDNDMYWYYIPSSGKVYVPDPSDSDYKKNTVEAVRSDLDDGEDREFDPDNNYVDYPEGTLLATMKKINGKTYMFDQHGRMLSDLVKIDNFYYYFGGWDNGSRQEGSITMKDDSGESFKFYFATDDDQDDGYFNAAGINGAKGGKLYENGLLVVAKDDKYEMKTVTVYYKDSNGDVVSKDADFIVNKSGTIQSSSKVYEEDDDELVDASQATFYKGEVDALKNSVTSWTK